MNLSEITYRIEPRKHVGCLSRGLSIGVIVAVLLWFAVGVWRLVAQGDIRGMVERVVAVTLLAWLVLAARGLIAAQHKDLTDTAERAGLRAGWTQNGLSSALYGHWGAWQVEAVALLAQSSSAGRGLLAVGRRGCAEVPTLWRGERVQAAGAGLGGLLAADPDAVKMTTEAEGAWLPVWRQLPVGARVEIGRLQGRAQGLMVEVRAWVDASAGAQLDDLMRAFKVLLNAYDEAPLKWSLHDALWRGDAVAHRQALCAALAGEADIPATTPTGAALESAAALCAYLLRSPPPKQDPSARLLCALAAGDGEALAALASGPASAVKEAAQTAQRLGALEGEARRLCALALGGQSAQALRQALPLLSPAQARVMIGWAVAHADGSLVVAALEVAASEAGEVAARGVADAAAWVGMGLRGDDPRPGVAQAAAALLGCPWALRATPAAYVLTLLGPPLRALSEVRDREARVTALHAMAAFTERARRHSPHAPLDDSDLLGVALRGAARGGKEGAAAVEALIGLGAWRWQGGQGVGALPLASGEAAPWQAEMVTAADAVEIAPTLTGALLPLGAVAAGPVAARVDPKDGARTAALLTPAARAHLRSLPIGATLRAVAGAWEVSATSDGEGMRPDAVAARVRWLKGWRDLHPTWPRADFAGLLARIPQEDDAAYHHSLWALLTAQADGSEAEVVARCRAQQAHAQGPLWLVCAAVTRDLDALRQRAESPTDRALGFSAQALRLWLEATPPTAPRAALSALAVRCARADDDTKRAALLDEARADLSPPSPAALLLQALHAADDLNAQAALALTHGALIRAAAAEADLQPLYALTRRLTESHDPAEVARGVQIAATCDLNAEAKAWPRLLYRYDPRVDAAVAQGFGLLTQAEYAKPLRELLKHAAPQVQAAAAHSMGQRGDLANVPPLRELLDSTSASDPRHAAAQAAINAILTRHGGATERGALAVIDAATDGGGLALVEQPAERGALSLAQAPKAAPKG